MKKTVVLVYSGGLDTSWCVVHLREKHGREVVTAVVDTGGFDAAELARIEWRPGGHAVPVVPAVLGEWAGALGAAAQALRPA